MNISCSPKPAWAAVDWGTSNLRIWLMGADDQPMHAIASAQGMGTLRPDQFESVLLTQLADWLDDEKVLPVICCGMVGARQGWSDAGYLSTPTAPSSAGSLHRIDSRDTRIRVAILPGVSQACPADVMRGEETQLAGLLHRNAGFDGSVCLPGTHSKWAHVRAGRIERFQTCMSGELFALLSSQSVLRHAMQTEQWSDDGFLQGVRQAIAQPERLMASLFALRAESLLQDTPAEVSRARLSGLLLGTELASTRDYWQDRGVTLIGDGRLSTLYARALDSLGVRSTTIEADALTLSGLTAAYHHLENSRS